MRTCPCISGEGVLLSVPTTIYNTENKTGTSKYKRTLCQEHFAIGSCYWLWSVYPNPGFITGNKDIHLLEFLAGPHNKPSHAHQQALGTMCSKFYLDDFETVERVRDTFHLHTCNLTTNQQTYSLTTNCWHQYPPSLISLFDIW